MEPSSYTHECSLKEPVGIAGYKKYGIVGNVL